ncbi:MAG: tetratricopeptide repeat protein [Oscillospiraceae bacterium]|nr:tetratricopeptide repeat protein [Oscillospiraceae bacterium]
MVSFQRKTRDKLDIEKKPRVYFTCHPEDFNAYFSKICQDIFKTHDCAVYYTEDMTEAIPREQQNTDLNHMNLVVVPVTMKLLLQPNRAMDEDIAFARKQQIPILPIMMEPGIEPLYARPDKFENLQFLTPIKTDSTAIPYEQKLKNFLESVLINEELANRIRAAFDAYIFLSYRKTDRHLANSLMQQIHSIPEYRDIAIWFDEFLTPGESFKENIEKILDDCNLFALLVTPRLLEKVTDPESGELRDNYVISTELPLAQKNKEEKGTQILPVEMEETDKTALAALDIQDCIHWEDRAFRERLLETLSKIAITPNHTPEHNYLIGLAYLEGIDVETNRALGLELLETAAEAGLTVAMGRLASLYKNVDRKKSHIWADRLYHHLVELHGEDHPFTMTILKVLATSDSDLGDYEIALERMEKVYDWQCDQGKANHPDTLDTMHNLANIYRLLHRHEKSLALHKKVYAQRCLDLGKTHIDTLAAYSSVASAYGDLGDHEKSLELLEKVYDLQCAHVGETHPTTLLTLSNWASTYNDTKAYDKAIPLLEKAYTLLCDSQAANQPHAIMVLNNLAFAYGKVGRHREAIERMETAYKQLCQATTPKHPDALAFLNNLAAVYENSGNHTKAIELYEKLYHLRCSVQSESHPDNLLYLLNLIDYCHKNGKDQKALAFYEIVYAQWETMPVGDYPSAYWEILSRLSCLSDIFGKDQRAFALSKQLYERQRKALGESDPATMTALNNMACACSNMGKHRKALDLLEKAYKLRRKHLGEDDPDTLTTLSSLAVTCYEMDKKRKGVELMQTVYRLRSARLGENHPDTRDAQTQLKTMRENG